MLKRSVIGLLFFAALIGPAAAQDKKAGTGKKEIKQDTVLPDGYRRNGIKWNLTPFFLWSPGDINLSYERVLSPYRSFSVNAGRFVLPSTSIYDSLRIVATKNKWGFTFSGDYRYYFKKRNKNYAPDGLFWGPFGSFHYTGFKNDILVFKSDGSQGNLLLNAQLGIVSAGVELGYQFVLDDRLTVDLIFAAPALSLYLGNIKFTGDLSLDEEDEYIQAVIDMLSLLFPGFGDDLVGDNVFTFTGYKGKFGFGARYLIQIGYRF